MASRIKAYLAAVADAKSAKASDPEGSGAAWNASRHAYKNLTREDCARLWPGSPESKDQSRKSGQ